MLTCVQLCFAQLVHLEVSVAMTVELPKWRSRKSMFTEPLGSAQSCCAGQPSVTPCILRADAHLVRPYLL